MAADGHIELAEGAVAAIAAAVGEAVSRDLAGGAGAPGTVLMCPYDFSAVAAGELLETYSVAQLRKRIPSKAEACRVIRELVRLLNEKVAQVASLTAELARLGEQAGRAREERFGQTSERRSALEGEPDASGDGAAGSDASGSRSANADAGANADANTNTTTNTNTDNDANAGSDIDADANADADTEANASANTNTTTNTNTDNDANADSDTDADANANANANAGADTSANAGAEAEAEGDGKTSFRAHNGSPKRHEGCGSEKRLEGAAHVKARETLTEEQVIEAFGEGARVKEMPDGHFSYVVYVTVPVVVDLSYQKLLNLDTGETLSATSAAEHKLRSQSDVSADLLCELVYDRTVLGVSVPRILKRWGRHGLGFSKQTMYRWYIQYALSLMRPLVARMLERALERGKVQSDETWARIREDLAREGKRNSVLWLLRTSEYLEIPQVVVVTYTGSRSSKALADIIRGYSVKVMCDGYPGYSALLSEFADKVELVGCLQHARSYFVDVIQALKGQRRYQRMSREQRSELPANRILDLFAKVFRAESGAKADATVEERARNRAERVRPALDELMAAVREEGARLAPTDRGYMRKAVDYAVKYEGRFYAAVDDPEMPISNSASERVFAGLGVIRANFRQVDTRLGAEAICLWFSALRTARENGSDEYVYLRYLVERLPGDLEAHGDFRWYGRTNEVDPDKLEGFGDLSYLDAHMPWSDGFREYAASFRERELGRIGWIAGLIAERGVA